MEKSINIAVPGKDIDAFVAALNRGNIPIKIVINGDYPDMIYEKLIYDDENYNYIGVKADDKACIYEAFKEYSDIDYFRLPADIQKDIVSRTKQNNCIGFLLCVYADDEKGGFVWSKTPEGDDWWNAVLGNNRYDLYFSKYPKSENDLIMKIKHKYLKLKTTSENLKDKIDVLREYGIECLSKYPPHSIYHNMYLIIDTNEKVLNCIVSERVAAMCWSDDKVQEACEDFFLLPDEVKKKAYVNSRKDIIRLLRDHISGWFVWSTSPEEHLFWNKWNNIIKQILDGEIKVSKEFDEWFITPPYPLDNVVSHGNGLLDQINSTWEYKPFSKEELDKAIDEMANQYPYKYGFKPEDLEDGLYNLIKRKENENQLQRKETDLHRGDGTKSVRVCNRRNKARVTKFSLSYKKVLGRG